MLLRKGQLLLGQAARLQSLEGRAIERERGLLVRLGVPLGVAVEVEPAWAACHSRSHQGWGSLPAEDRMPGPSRLANTPQPTTQSSPPSPSTHLVRSSLTPSSALSCGLPIARSARSSTPLSSWKQGVEDVEHSTGSRSSVLAGERSTIMVSSAPIWRYAPDLVICDLDDLCALMSGLGCTAVGAAVQSVAWIHVA